MELPLASFRFRFEVAGLEAGRFRAVSGLQSRTELIEWKRGGDARINLRPGRTRWGQIGLERGLTAGRVLWDWRRRILDGEDDRRDCAIVVLAPDGTDHLRYELFEAWPCSWDGPALLAREDGTAVERIELAVDDVRLD